MSFTLVLFGLILCLAAVVQSLVGFGLALLAVPALLAAGVPLFEAIFAVLCISLCQGLIGLIRLRSEASWGWCWRASLWRLLGLLPGLALVLGSDGGTTPTVQAAVAAVLLLGVSAQATKMVCEPSRSSKTGPEAYRDPQVKMNCLDRASFACSGLFMGWLGMGGPPLIFWLLHRNWPPNRCKAFLYSLFVVTSPIQLGLMAWHAPERALEVGRWVLSCLPAVWACSWLALRSSERWSTSKTQWASLLLMLILAAKNLAQGFHG